MVDVCEFWTYKSFEYFPNDTSKEYPYADAPYHIGYFDKFDKHGNHKGGVELCKLTACHRRCDCNELNKQGCSRYQKHLEYKKKPKPPVRWNHETKRLEYGVDIDWNNWNM